MVTCKTSHRRYRHSKNACHLSVNNKTASPKKEYLSQYLENRQTFVYLKKMHFYLGVRGIGGELGIKSKAPSMQSM